MVFRLYAMAQSTPPGSTYQTAMEEKRVGILNHIRGVHKHPGHRFFKECSHSSSVRPTLDECKY